MSFHQLVSDMRLYVRRVYGAELQGPPIPMQKGIWHVWIREPGARRGRMVKVSHAQLRRKTSNDMSRKKAKKIVTRRAFRALRVIYSPANRAYFVMWHTDVLRTFHDKAEAEAYARSLTSHTSNDPSKKRRLRRFRAFRVPGSAWEALVISLIGPKRAYDIQGRFANKSDAFDAAEDQLATSYRYVAEVRRKSSRRPWKNSPQTKPRHDPSRPKKRRGLLYGLARRTGKRPSDFNPRELAKGTRVEMEHTTRRSVARQIAMDHLTEDPRYYSKMKNH